MNFFDQRTFKTFLLILASPILLLSASWSLSAQDAGGVDDPVPQRVAAQDPDFSDIDDPLNGDNELFTVDDLVMFQTDVGSADSQVYNFLLETENQSIKSQKSVNPANPDCVPTSVVPALSRAGRWANTGNDLIVTLTPSSNATGDCSTPADNVAIQVYDPVADQTAGGTTTMSPNTLAVVMDDFNQDGYDDLFVISNAQAFVATAADVFDFASGGLSNSVSFGPKVAITAAMVPDYTHAGDPTSGDFNGDGLLDVAWAANDESIHFATVCPTAVAGTVCENAEPLAVILDPLESRTDLIPPTIGVLEACQDRVKLSAGKFQESATSDDLIVLQRRFDADGVGNQCQLHAYWYEFNGDFLPTELGTEILVNHGDQAGGLQNRQDVLVQSGKLNWLGSTEQVVVGIGGINIAAGTMPPCPIPVTNSYNLFIFVIDFEQGEMTSKVIRQNFTDTCPDYYDAVLNGLALGRFESIPSNPSSEADFNLQIAVLTNDGVIRIYDVDAPTDYTPKVVSATPLDAALGFHPRSPGLVSRNVLVSGDLQGRSARLGAPTVVRVTSHSQPSVILGAPPMHVDYVQPDSSTASDWEVVNFSAVPDAFYSSYTMSETASNQSSDTNTTSYTYATSEMKGLKVGLTLPHLPSISGSIKTTSENKSDSVAENYAFTKDEFTYDASTTTGISDEIWYDENSFNIYFYPVLGETVCPADNSTCSPGEEQQLYVSFSGPNSAGTGPAPGDTTEWYQPVHEPGNLFSFPWNETQLRSHMGAIDILSGPHSFFTDDSGQTQTVNWTTNSGSSSSAGTTNTQSFDKAYSMTAGKEFGEILNVDIGGNLDYNSSTAVSTLIKSTSSVGDSQGIKITKPSTFRNPGLYQYRVEPYIFGREATPGMVDQANLTETLQTTGPLQSAYTVNPLDPNAGSWWGSDENPYLQEIDVALNHPVRWTWNELTGIQPGVNCLVAAPNLANCYDFKDPNAADLWNSEYYWMRGLFVTVGGAAGPQRTQATEGDDIFLEARVYNYSFKDMDSDSTIQVRFYRQEMQGTTPVGDSVLIAQETAEPLPGFNSTNAPSDANWATVRTSFDSSGLGDKHFIFWVLVWVEDGSGNMVTELSGHGLSAKPGTLTSIGDVPLEQVTLDDAQKTFSNNVGYLHQRFYIAEQSSQQLLGLNAAGSDTGLAIENAQVTPAEVQRGERVIVSADISAEDATENVHVRVYPDAATWRAYQDDPSLPPPRPFDVEMLPYIRAGEMDRLEVPYRRSTCGTHEILITANSGVQTEEVVATAKYSTGACQVFFPIFPVTSVVSAD